MASQVISFRFADEAIEALKALALPGESLSQAAQRVLHDTVTGRKTRVSTSSTVDTSVDKDWIEDLVKGYYAQAMTQMEGAIAELRQEVGQRLGE